MCIFFVVSKVLFLCCVFRAEREKAEAKQMLDSNKQEMMDYKSKVAKELKEVRYYVLLF